MPPYTQRILHLPPYPLANIPQKKRELIARGVDLIDLGAGDADLAPPQAALDRMADAIREPAMGRYGFAMGLMAYREAIVRNSPAIVLAHNHPSGDLDPSPEDIELTRALLAAGDLLDIQLLDHLIISQTGWRSLREMGLGFPR